MEHGRKSGSNVRGPNDLTPRDDFRNPRRPANKDNLVDRALVKLRVLQDTLDCIVCQLERFC